MRNILIGLALGLGLSVAAQEITIFPARMSQEVILVKKQKVLDLKAGDRLVIVINPKTLTTDSDTEVLANYVVPAGKTLRGELRLDGEVTAQ